MMLNLGKLGKQIGDILDEFTGAAEKRRQAENAPYEIPYSVFADPILNQPTHDDSQVLTIGKEGHEEVSGIWRLTVTQVQNHLRDKEALPGGSTEIDVESDNYKTELALSNIRHGIEIARDEQKSVRLPASLLESLVRNIGFLHQIRDEIADIAKIPTRYQDTGETKNDNLVILDNFRQTAEQTAREPKRMEEAAKTVFALDLLLPAIEEKLPPLLYARKPHLDPANDTNDDLRKTV